MPRKYTKRSDYWKKFGKEVGASNLEDLLPESDSIAPATAGDSYYTEAAVARNVNQNQEDMLNWLFHRQIDVQINCLYYHLISQLNILLDDFHQKPHQASLQ